MSRTGVAKVVYKAGGLLGRIKTPQRTYKVTNIDVSSGDLEFGSAEVRWIPCHVSVKLMLLSMKIDPDHFDHWALAHTDDCTAQYCTDCKGYSCDGE